jgi:hypothetical protein
MVKDDNLHPRQRSQLVATASIVNFPGRTIKADLLRYSPFVKETKGFDAKTWIFGTQSSSFQPIERKSERPR